jgi:hypothetical protein
MRRLVITIGLLFSTTACTSVEALRPDMEARPVPSRLDEIAYINGLRQAYAAASAPCYNGKNLKPFKPKFVQGYRQTDPDADQASESLCIQFKPSEPDKKSTQPKMIQDYLDNGFGLTDLYCSRFIMVAAETRQSRKMQKNTVSGVGALVAIALNAVSAGADAITVASGGFAAIDSTYKNIDDAFVISPDKESLIRLVQNAQDTYRKQARGTPPRSFAEARSKIERYASLCTFDGMRALVNSSIQLASQTLKKESKEEPKTKDEKGLTPPEPRAAEEKETPATDLLVPQ